MNMSLLGLLRLRPVCVQLLSRLKYPNKCGLDQKISIQFRNISENFSKPTGNTSEISKTEQLKSKSSSEKDQILFFYENPTFYKILNVFAFIQFLFWCHTAKFTYTSIKDIKTNENAKDKLPWWLKIDFQNEKNRKLVSGFCLFMGYSIMFMAWLYTTRSVRLLVLRKDEKTISFVTYSVFGKRMITDVPLEKISTNVSRTNAKNQLPIKVQGKWFYYILDTKNGTFKNPRLFDFTAGMKRTFSK